MNNLGIETCRDETAAAGVPESALCAHAKPVLRAYWALALAACAVLAGAAVWMGGLNQDEGWYLYAANLVAKGRLPYRDFAFTQGPVMPLVYSAFTGAWQTFGLLGARVVTLALGLVGILFAMGTARRLVVDDAKKGVAALVVFFLLATNLYHLYYLAIPKTYALAGLFVSVAFFLLTWTSRSRGSAYAAFGAGLCLALAAGTRISLGAILPAVGLWLLAARRWKALAAFCVGGFGGLALAYGPFLLDAASRNGLLAAQAYHAARGGFDVTWTVGSLSRLVRWYLPVFLVLGLGGFRRARPLLAAFLAVFAVQILAPFPYEDYQVPIMGLLAVFAAVNFVTSAECPAPRARLLDPALAHRARDRGEACPAPRARLLDPALAHRARDRGEACPAPRARLLDPALAHRARDRGGECPAPRALLLVLGLAFATAFGSPLLEKWTTNGQDRFWSLKKGKTELAQLRDVAAEIEALDPGGTTLLTQDLYLAVETGRSVPRGLEMGPFSILSDADWRRILTAAECPVAALSGYTFAIEPPACHERATDEQLAYWSLLKENYAFVRKEPAFGQNATPLLILTRKGR